ncbi:MAG: hypothetical protein H8E26_11640 [FCB group bacterium]|nr:hypothetical protein [FCB group bacterium]MBL7028567.1 hypothetical protein [Candidatus Neomarinimicrobiota bacterium]MBL7120786.1 hypothetical protein [Candidatus Neomarinimicrobiota bacterium]
MKKSSMIFTGILVLILSVSGANSIYSQKLTMHLSGGDHFFIESLMQNEIAETEVNHTILAGPLSHREKLARKHDHILIFIKGVGTLRSGSDAYSIEPESIALTNAQKRVLIEVAAGDTLHYIHIKKKLSKLDQKEMKTFPSKNREGIYFKRFVDCEAYTEKIKSPNTVSRTVLPKDHAPRVAMGTVDTKGPDAVGAHEHPMLDQLFLGLSGNDAMVFAGTDSIAFHEWEILHIPIGASHWVTVGENKRMYYQWMDFFLTTAGQEWLKTHKKIDDYNNTDKK